MLTCTLLTPKDYTGTIMDLCQTRRGEMIKLEYLSPERMELVYKIPLAEVVRDFFDQLKSRTQGYASLDYEDAGYATSDLVKVDVLLNSAPADAFSRSEEHTSELQSLMRISYAVFCLTKKHTIH